MSKGKTIFRGGLISEGIVSGKNEIETIYASGSISVGRNYLSDTAFDVKLLATNEVYFNIKYSTELIGNTYMFYVSDSPATATGALIKFTASAGSSFFGLASCSDGNLTIRNSTEVVVNESRYLKGCLINVRILSANQISINITSPDALTNITTS